MSIWYFSILKRGGEELISNNTSQGNYVKIPRHVIESNYDNPLALLVFSCLYIHRGLNDIANTSILQLIRECGYKPDKHKGKIYDRIIYVLEDFKACGYIEYESLDLKRGNSLIEISINSSCFDSPSSFAIIWLHELEKIQLQNTIKQKVKPEYLILLLSYMRVNKMRRQKYDDIQRHPEIFYKHQKIISQDIFLSYTTLRRCIETLEQLNIIATAPIDRFRDPNGKWHTNVTVFVDKYDGWEVEIKNGIRLLKSMGSIMKNKTDNKHIECKN